MLETYVSGDEGEDEVVGVAHIAIAQSRTCYNCGSASHFVKECPFDPREENEGKLIRKDKGKAPDRKSVV